VPLTVDIEFVIDPAKKIRLMHTYPQSCGRNFDEVLRAVDSLRVSDAHNVITPASWRSGDEVIIPPSLTDEEAQ
jgi:alkyl hydroperoxide reductase subunit AhpC